MKDLRPIRGHALLCQWIAEGEHEHQDFKFAISDARKIARSISAFANNGGGRLLIGVKDNGNIAGVRNEEDIYVVEQAAERYCRPAQHVEFKAYKAEGGVCVIAATIARADVRPVSAGEPDGSWRAYYRVADENIAAHPLMVRAWQRASDPAAPSLALMREHTELLRLVESAGTVASARAAALALHISQPAAEELIISLAAAGLLTFRHNGSAFVIASSDGE